MPRHMVSNRRQIPFAAAVPCLLSLYCLIRPSFSSSLLFIPLLGGSQDHIEEVVRTGLESMEGGKKPSSSIADELFPTGKYAPPPSSTNLSSSSPGYFNSVFPPASSVLGKSQGNPFKTQTVRSKDVKSVSTSRSEESAYFGSSVHYGGRDFYDSSASNQPSGAPKPIKDLDKGENSNDPNAANRGEWWQGSLYY